jgi:hypothetical protein
MVNHDERTQERMMNGTKHQRFKTLTRNNVEYNTEWYISRMVKNVEKLGGDYQDAGLPVWCHLVRCVKNCLQYYQYVVSISS